MDRDIQFYITDYTVDYSNNSVNFNYQIIFDSETTENLSEKLLFPTPITDTPETTFLLQQLHIGLAISYYKTFYTPKINHPYELTDQLASFWNEIYLNGLAEFLYTNKLDPKNIARFESSTDATEHTFDGSNKENHVLLGIGGGKDSVVAGELFKSSNIPVTGFVLASGAHEGKTKDVARIMGIDLLVVQRYFDRSIIALQQSHGGYNGHIPISMIFALTGILLAEIKGYDWVAVGNEAAANDINTSWMGLEVNHQWSKSLHFETLLQKTFAGLPLYFSATRSMSSVAMLKIFANLSQYHNVFTSCNLVLRMDPNARPNGRWCGACAKCLSTFILLSPWMDESAVIDIFGQNLLDNPELTDTFNELIGVSSHKPLDCVGTIDEISTSVGAIIAQNKFSGSRLIKTAAESGKYQDSDYFVNRLNELANNLSPDLLPTEIRDIMHSSIQGALAPPQT